MRSQLGRGRASQQDCRGVFLDGAAGYQPAHKKRPLARPFLLRRVTTRYGVAPRKGCTSRLPNFAAGNGFSRLMRLGCVSAVKFGSHLQIAHHHLSCVKCGPVGILENSDVRRWNYIDRRRVAGIPV